MKAAGLSGCQRTPWREELDGKGLHGAAGGEYEEEPRESVVLCIWSTRSQRNPSKRLQKMWYHVSFKGGGVLLDLLFSCTVVHYLTVFSLANCTFVHTDKSSDIRKKVASLNSRIASLYVASARLGSVVPENSRSQVIRRGLLIWRGHYRLKPHDCLRSVKERLYPR